MKKKHTQLIQLVSNSRSFLAKESCDSQITRCPHTSMLLLAQNICDPQITRCPHTYQFSYNIYPSPPVDISHIHECKFFIECIIHVHNVHTMFWRKAILGSYQFLQMCYCHSCRTPKISLCWEFLHQTDSALYNHHSLTHTWS